MKKRVIIFTTVMVAMVFVIFGCGCSLFGKASEFYGTWENNDGDRLEINRDGTIEEDDSDGKHYKYVYEVDKYPTLKGDKYILKVSDITNSMRICDLKYDEESGNIFTGYEYSTENSYKKQ